MPFLKPFAMPLSELLHRLTKGKFDFSQDKSPTTSIDPSFPAENDFVELVWENGQIQSSRARKAQSCNNSPSQLPKVRERDIGYGSSTKIAKCGTMEPVLSEIPLPVPSVEMGLSEDDNMVAWLNYPINESLQHDYTSEFLPQLSGVSVNEHSDNNFSSFGKRSSGDRSTRDGVSVHHGLNLEQGTVLKVSSTGNGEASRPRTSAGELYSSLPQQCQTSFPHFRSTILVNNDDSRSNDDNHALPAAVDKIHPTAGGGFPSIKMQKRVPVPSTTNFNVMNFLHFSRPVASVKASLQNDGVKAGSGITGLEGTGTKNKGSTTSSFSHSENMLIKPCGDICDEKNSSCHPNTVSSKVDANLLEAMPGKELFPGELRVDVNRKDDPKKYKNNCQNLGESSNKGFEDSEKNREPVVASSVCSVNSMKTPSDDPAQNLKRKNRDSEESEGPSEDIGEESVGAKRVPPAKVGRGSKSKRSRAAEVHNLSERRRRDRINEKMRALQELIPNCNKVDKASMLDEAIEYLKTLQLQLQIMSMGSGLYMPSMMLPPGMPHLHTAHMAQFSPMGVRMGMGMPDMSGKASSCSMIQVPPMNGAHFPGPPLSGPGSFHGMQGCNLHMFGLSGQGLPMAFPRAPLVPMPGGPLVKPTMGSDSSGFASSMENLDSAPKSCSKDSIQNINSQRIQNDGAGSSMNQTSQTALVQSNAEVNDNGALQSASGNVKESLRTDGCD